MSKYKKRNYSVNEVYRHSALTVRKDQTRDVCAKVLIAGAGSYIGENVERYLLFHGDYKVHTLDTIKLVPSLEQFKGYDVVLFVAGVAHRKETKENAHLYFEVNRDLAVKTARTAKKAGVKQFIILSSMSVYGMETGYITKNTKTSPKSYYGRSKLAADKKIWELRDKNFRAAILRPPIVYGNGCQGNYQLLRKLALLTPVFPNTDNKRSMIYIGNLCSFVKDVIDQQREGIFFPQNSEYVNTSELAGRIALANGKKIRETKIFNPVIKFVHARVIDKVFRSLTYEKTDTVSTYNFDDSIALTESRIV